MNQDIEQHILLQYKPIQFIKLSSQGKFWEVKSRTDNQLYILNKKQNIFDHCATAQQTFRQIEYLMKIQHPSIIRLVKVLKSVDKKDIYIVFQYMPTYLEYLIRQKMLNLKQKRIIIYQVALALYYLHSANLIHRHIKSSTILINENCIAKISDFSLTRSIQQSYLEQKIYSEIIADRWYSAPQVLLGSQQYSKSIDIWSFGCLLGQLILNKPLFPGNSGLNQLQKIINWTGVPNLQDLKALKTDFGQQLINLFEKIQKIDHTAYFSNQYKQTLDLLNLLLVFNPKKRPSILQIIKHPFFKQQYKQSDLIKAPHKMTIFQSNQKISVQKYRELIFKSIDESRQLTSQKFPTFMSEKLRPLTTKPKKTKSINCKHINSVNNKHAKMSNSHTDYNIKYNKTIIIEKAKPKQSKEKMMNKKLANIQKRKNSKNSKKKTIKTEQKQLSKEKSSFIICNRLATLETKMNSKKAENIGKYMYKNRCF